MNQQEIAKIANVSSATISRVINSDPCVAEKTRLRVQKVIEENAYVCNVNARNLRSSRTKSIGFLISNLCNPFFIGVYSGFEAVCKKNGYNIIIGNTNEDIKQEREEINLFLQYRVDGIVASFVGPSPNLLKELKSYNSEILMLDRLLKNFESDSITIDNAGGAEKQVEYLANLGHKKIALIKGTDFDSNGLDRLKGFYTGMNKMCIPVNPEYVMAGKFLEDTAYVATVELMHLTDPPTSIIAHNNLMCIGAYKALKDMRISIPGDVSLIGFDGFEFSEHLQPSMTLIDRPVREMGELAGEMIINRIEKKYVGEPRSIVFPVKLKIGESCGIPKS